MKMTPKGIVRKIRKTLGKNEWRDITIHDFDSDCFLGGWPKSGQSFGLWVPHWKCYVNC